MMFSRLSPLLTLYPMNDDCWFSYGIRFTFCTAFFFLKTHSLFVILAIHSTLKIRLRNYISVGFSDPSIDLLIVQD